MRARTEYGMLVAVVFLAAGVMFGAPGCGGNAASSGGSDEPVGQDQTAKPPARLQGPEIAQSEAPAGARHEVDSAEPQKAGPVHVDSDGRKWIENIPYDVWFEDPIAVANDTRPVPRTARTDGPPESIKLTGDNGGASPRNALPSSEGDGATESSTSPGTEWTKIVPAAVLDAEVKNIRNRMTQSMQTVGRYNAHYQEIEVDGTTLAAMAVIARQHPGSLRWKEHALYLRDLGTAIADSATALGRKAFEQTLESYEYFVGILNGSKPAVMAEPDPEADMMFTVYRGGVMKRMERAFKQLKGDVSNKQTLLAKRDDILHEAGILTAFGKLITHPDYSSASDTEYVSYAQELVQAGLDIRKSVEEDSYDGFQDALNRVQKSCNDCHADYRFSGDL